MNIRVIAAVFFLTGLSLAGVSAIAQGQAVSTAENFVMKASVGDRFEIMSSQLALERSGDMSVRNFAETMINDHTASARYLKEVLDDSNTDIIPASTLDARHQEMLDNLKAASNAEFDEKYVDVQVEAHREAVILFQDYADRGDNEALRNFALETLPTLKQHQQRILALDQMS